MNIEGPKYKLGEKHPENDVYRIIALRDFGDVKAGEYGGWIASGHNLSHEGNCWVFRDAWVYGNARVHGDARVYGHARVYGEAQVFGNARVYDDARVYGDARVFENARVCWNARVHGNAQISGNAKISESYVIRIGSLDSSPSIEDLLCCSVGIPAVNGVVRLYKRVNVDMSSEYDDDFIYPESGLVEAKEVDEDPSVSCGSGLHFSHKNYRTWIKTPKHKILAADIRVEDIICVQDAKVRCRKATIVGIVE